ncbi:MAG: PAS domain-containing protein, partial [Gammaproteobacteria bacterium]
MTLPAVPVQANTDTDTESVLDQLETGVALLDAGGALVYANPAFCELFAVSPSRSRGLTLHALGEAERVFAPLAARVRAQAMTLRLREQQLETRAARPLHADVSISPWSDDRVLI